MLALEGDRHKTNARPREATGIKPMLALERRPASSIPELENSRTPEVPLPPSRLPEGALRQDQAAARAVATLSSERSSTKTRPRSPAAACGARSGWGMRPTTLPASLEMPAMSSAEPLGLSL